MNSKSAEWKGCSADGERGVWENGISSEGRSGLSQLLITSPDSFREKNSRGNLQNGVEQRTPGLNQDPTP